MQGECDRLFWSGRGPILCYVLQQGGFGSLHGSFSVEASDGQKRGRRARGPWPGLSPSGGDWRAAAAAVR